MDLSKINGEIWFDGQMIDWQEANTHLLTHTLHYGLGVFEGVRAYKTNKGPSIFRLHDHTDRLFKSASTVNIEIPYSSSEQKKVCADKAKNKYWENNKEKHNKLVSKRQKIRRAYQKANSNFREI